MKLTNIFEISWDAPITPYQSMAGIPLGASASVLETILCNYLIDGNDKLYKFKNSPTLHLAIKKMDDHGDGGYQFRLADEETLHKNLNETPALTIEIKSNKVFTVTTYNFSFPDDIASESIYKGALPGGIKLGSLVSDLIPLTRLEFDDIEECFYTDKNYGEVEITGWCVPLEDEPNQIITEICVIPNKAQ
ncbi:hypothetical protein [Pseudomonas syringae]|jgi:hypothetical protein|uniref:hypothetical protein n=1 Tax=Pseudomonas syringae TaxID=317 RepID=UPI0020C0D6CD|nr:hypothetical protein [Pseudomonas syringae]